MTREVESLIDASSASAGALRAAGFGARRTIRRGAFFVLLLLRALAFLDVFFAVFVALFVPFALFAIARRCSTEWAAMPNSALALILTIAAVLPAAAQSESPLGTWRLVSYHTETPDGVRTFPLGEDVAGIAMYLPNGRVSIQFMRKNRPLFKSGDAWRGTLEEERAAFEGYFAYTGRFTIDAAQSRVTHHIEICSAPNYVGTDLVRTFSISGNRLTLRTPQRQLAGQTSASTLVWERID